MKMKKSFVLFAVILTALLFISVSASVSGDAEKMQDINALDLSVNPQDINSRGTVKPDLNFGKFPLYFIFNKGQVNEKAKFYAKASRYTLWLTKEGLVFDSVKKVEVEDDDESQLSHSPHSPKLDATKPPSHQENSKDKKGIQHSSDQFITHHSSPDPLTKYERDVSRLSFINANKNPEMVSLEEAKHRVNYFIGNDKSKWHCDIPTSQAVLYKNLYKDIDLKVYGIEKQIEYDWIVKPRGNPKEIKFEYKNVKGTRIDDEGNLLIETDFGELMHKKPVSYQESKAHSAKCKAKFSRIFVNVEFKKIGKNTYGFEVGEYDKNSELIIDPVVLAYSTYLGGNGEEEGRAIAVDNSGNVYVTGYTQSTDFPTWNQYQTDPGDLTIDAFVTKIDTTQSGASSLIYSTYLGGENDDYGYGIAMDSSGNAYVTGYTESTDFPTLNQFQTDPGDNAYDVFVTKLDTTQSGASSLIYSTYLGGGNDDYGYGIAVDSSGNAYVTGSTYSTDFPTLNQYQSNLDDYNDVFVTKIDMTQSGISSLIYSTYLGRGGRGYGIAVDSSGNAYVTGWNATGDFPVLNQYQLFQGGGPDAFVTKIDTTQSGSSSLIYSTYLGGGDIDEGSGIAVDSSGNAYVTGYTYSTDFPSLAQYQDDQRGIDAFLTKIDTTQSGASSLIYSTYLGGNDSDYGSGIAVDSNGNAYVIGVTNGLDFPTLNQYQTNQGSNDAFVTKIDTTQSGASSLIYSTYLGGGNRERCYGIALDSSGNAYVTAWTESTDFPILNQYQTDQGGMDAFVTKLSYIIPPTVSTAAVSSVTGTSASSGGNVTSDGGAAVTARGICWSISTNPTIADSHTTDGAGIGAFTSSITGLIPGITYHVRAYATNSVGTSYGNDVTFTTNALVPTITTTAVSNITSTTASSGGNVADAGGAAVTARGVCWSTSANPTTANSHTTDGNGVGTFTSSITGLNPGITYHFRAYATNSVGTSYGNDVTFTTIAMAPTVTTTAVSNITATTAASGGNITSDGGAAVTARGVCWSTSANPTTSDNHTTDGTGTGTYTSSITGLTPASTYHVRAYATNSVGTSYGNDVTFTTNAVAPTVTTTAVSNITLTTASSGGNVTDNGGSAVSARGVCWSTSSNPTTSGSHTTDGSGTGTFTSSITGLTPDNTYYLRAYATNTAGTGYGNQVTFTTAVNPTISGTVKNGTNLIEGVTITFSHDGHTETTTADGNYSYTVPNGTSTVVTASKPGYTFTPSQYSYTDLTENKPNQDFTVLYSVSVIITNLQNGDTVSGAVIINAEVSSQDASAAYAYIQAVTKVEFYIDGGLVKQDTSAPYQHRWETTLVSNGNHTIEAKAYHSSGITGQHVIMVNVSNSTEPPHITLNRTSLNFGAVIGDPPSDTQTFLITNSGGGTLNWTASASEIWIQATPLNGAANTQVTVSMDITGLNIGDYAGTVTITDANADNSPVAVNIFLTVNDEGEDLPLIGSIDSPIDGSTVSGSIPVTGWALDDAEIASVKIYRHPIWGQELGFVYIGEAVFIEGARPDIEIQYPEYPRNYEAGWGYMLLTNFLPNEGNGTFVITAIATDKSSSEVVLGSKTIICDNENSTKPFGTIDTPSQGGDAFGTDFVNWGWALTPLPNTIPMDGSTIKVWVDGVPLIGNPVYNQYREDIATAFPGYNNNEGAVGYYYLDTTLYANGIHTISWSVTDDAGNTSGIGSRYFGVLNVENPSAGSVAALGHPDNMTIQNLPVSSTPIYLKKGYKTDGEQYILYPDSKGSITIEIKEDERVEIELGDKNGIAGSTNSWVGFQVIGHMQRLLPIGSTLDTSKGIFYWQPGPGFIGQYRLVFIEKGQDGEFKKRKIKVVIKPEF